LTKLSELFRRYGGRWEYLEDQLGALGLVLNVIVLWNTIYIEAALEQLRQDSQVHEEDVARLSPLIHDHINLLGRYSFAIPEAVIRGELRPLHNPAADDVNCLFCSVTPDSPAIRIFTLEMDNEYTNGTHRPGRENDLCLSG
jgi:hypothetical protein